MKRTLGESISQDPSNKQYAKPVVLVDRLLATERISLVGARGTLARVPDYLVSANPRAPFGPDEEDVPPFQHSGVRMQIRVRLCPEEIKADSTHKVARWPHGHEARHSDCMGRKNSPIDLYQSIIYFYLWI